MRKRDEPQIFKDGKCSAAGSRCDKSWEAWCRGCNLVYCKTHLDRGLHDCPSRDKRSQATASRFDPFKGDLALERGGISCAPADTNGTAASAAKSILPRNGQNGKHKSR